MIRCFRQSLLLQAGFTKNISYRCQYCLMHIFYSIKFRLNSPTTVSAYVLVQQESVGLTSHCLRLNIILCKFRRYR
jgi:hypothetical protein